MKLRWVVPLFIGFFITLFFGGIFLVLLFFAAPELEGRKEIIRASHVVGSVHRKDGELCWDTSFEKLDDRPPALFAYRILYKGLTIPTYAYRLDEKGKKTPLSSYGFAVHKKGDPPWVSHYCIEVPPYVQNDVPFTVEGIGYYDSNYGPWRVPQKLPPFTVMPNTASLWAPENKPVPRPAKALPEASEPAPSQIEYSRQND